MPEAPVIAIDGPTASGKGTVAERVASALGWHYLDSGSLYRMVALKALRAAVDTGDGAGLAALADGLAPRFEGGRILVDGEDVTDEIRAEAVGVAASKVAAQPLLRAALLGLQRRARRAPGLVGDGRDMGTVVFPDAVLKVYLTASVESRAARRHKQLMEKGFSANICDLSRDLAERDARDMQRAEAPLRPAEGALVVDSTSLSIDETVEAVLDAYRRRAAA
ncbi:MAG TPA: (d)CMP kinase [Quisquiliibacterium sp.]|nr:(d)CMP kinase [Quisquiliibacterium sp.]